VSPRMVPERAPDAFQVDQAIVQVLVSLQLRRGQPERGIGNKMTRRDERDWSGKTSGV
jgi:hypothetical protein